MNKFTVTEEFGDIRIDKYLIEKLGFSRSKIQKLISHGKVIVNGKEIKNSYLIKENDDIQITGEIDEPVIIQSEKIDLDIIYEDEDVIVVNKPSGMVVHPSLGHQVGTLVNALLYHRHDLSSINENIRPGIVHRIDKDTSGLLLVAKNDVAHIHLSEQLKRKTVVRKYIALAQGIIMHDKGTIDAPIGRDPFDRKKMAITDVNAKEAVTHFKVIERLNGVTLIECQLETGRTHQIRLHMKYIGHPIVNDPVYGFKKIINNFGQMLHAKVIGFNHPKDNRYMEFEVPVPKEFEEIINSFR